MTSDASDAALRAEIVQTRADLGETIEALAAKTNVTARTKEAVVDAVDHAKETVHDVGDQALGMGSTIIRRVADAIRGVIGMVTRKH